MKYLLLVLMLMPAIISAQIPQPVPNSYIHDYAKVLSSEQIAGLNKQISAIEKTYKVQMAVVLVEKLPVDMAIEDYSLQIGREWGVGKVQRGLVYVASISERKQRLEVSTRLQGVIPDMTANVFLIDNKPYFKNKDYGGGISNMITSISKELKVEAEAATVVSKSVEKNSGVGCTVFTILFGLGILTMIFYVRQCKINKRKREEEEQQRELAESRREAEQQENRYIKSMLPEDSPMFAHRDRIRREVEIRRRRNNTMDSGYSTGPKKTIDSDSNNYISPAIIPDNDSNRSSSSDDSYRSSSSNNDYGNYSSNNDTNSSPGYDGGGSSSNDW